MEAFRTERTLVIVKPDGVARGLVGEILRRFEQAGLKIVALKMLVAGRALIDKHYPKTEEWIRTVGGKTKEGYETYGVDVRGQMGTDDLLEIGRQVRGWLLDFMTSGPVVAFVLEGVHAVSAARKITGKTLPIFAEPGTIRGDFSVDAPTVANAGRRPIRNLIHASGTVEEAQYEIGLWFEAGEIAAYRRADEGAMFG